MALNRRDFLLTASGAALGLAAAPRLALAAGDEMVFGAVLPLTGASATIGEDQRRGIDLAVDKINAAGGVLGKPLKVIVEDSAGDVQTALEAARKLVSINGAKVLIGEYSSGITVPLRQAAAGMGVVQINCGSSSVKLRQPGGGLAFSVIGLDDLMARFTATALKGKGLAKAAVILPNNAYGESMRAQFDKAFTAAGGTVARTLLYTEGQSSYRGELQQLQQFQPDVYVYSAYGQEAAIINREGFELGLKKTPWFGIYLTMCVSDAPKETVEGQLGAEVNFIGPDSAWYQTAYKAKYKEDFRSAFNGYTYDAVSMAAEAIDAAKASDAKAIVAAARGLKYQGATGLITLDADNERAEQDYLNVTVKDGKVVPV